MDVGGLHAQLESMTTERDNIRLAFVSFRNRRHNYVTLNETTYHIVVGCVVGSFLFSLVTDIKMLTFQDGVITIGMLKLLNKVAI